MKTREELCAEIDKLRKKVWAIDAKNDYKNARKMIGKYYIHENSSYSCPTGQGDYWGAFRKVTAVTRSGAIVCEEFQTDRDGKIEIVLRKIESHQSGEWKEISKARYQRELKKVKTKIAGMK